MNCANHPDRERTAFCQNCGKPLCPECVRTIGASIFCEPCYAIRSAGAAAPGYTPVPGYTSGPISPGYTPGPAVPGEPNPGLAALLGFIPGVGAMYNEQYAKGIVHLIVFALLVSFAHDVSGIFGLFVAGWICYMVIEAHHTARARRDGTPLPNPFGLNDLSERLGFGKAWPSGAPTSASFTSAPGTGPTPSSGPAPDPGAANPNVPPANPYGYAPPYSYVPPVSHWGPPQDTYAYSAPPIPPVPPVPPMPPYADPNVPYYRRFPAGAIWLIGLGVFFLLGNTGLFHVRARYFGPFVLIAVGVWTFVRKMTYTGQGMEDDGTPLYHMRLVNAFRSSVWIVLTGVIWLLDVFGILSWGHSWPLFLIAGGIMMFFKHTAYGGYGYGPGPGGYPGYPNTPPPASPVIATALVPLDPTDPHPRSGNTSNGSQEGR